MKDGKLSKGFTKDTGYQSDSRCLKNLYPGKERLQMKRQLSLLLAVLLLVTSLAGCAGSEKTPAYKGSDNADPITVTVRIIDGSNGSHFDGQVEITKTANPVADNATTAALDFMEIPYEKADGFYSSFDGIASTETDGWLLYVNDEAASLGAEEQPIADGDVITWRYVNYNEAFSSEE